jgi:hypothetical protein
MYIHTIEGLSEGLDLPIGLLGCMIPAPMQKLDFRIHILKRHRGRLGKGPERACLRQFPIFRPISDYWSYIEDAMPIINNWFSFLSFGVSIRTLKHHDPERVNQYHAIPRRIQFHSQ